MKLRQEPVARPDEAQALQERPVGAPELPVLRDCSDRLKNVKNLFVEYHGTYDKPAELNEILDILLRQGFTYCVREGAIIHSKPFWDMDVKYEWDMLLNIFAFRR